MKIIDTHCHIQFNGFKDDYEEVIERCKEKNCTMFAVGTQKDTSAKAVEFAQKYDNVYAIVGLHPIHSISTEVDEEETHFVSREEEFDYEYYKKLAQNKKVVGIGECGIELFHIPEDRDKDEILAVQKKTFLAQIKLAQELNLPMSIHIRDAYKETTDILNEYPSLALPLLRGGEIDDRSHLAIDSEVSLPLNKGEMKRGYRGVIHCYSSNWENAQKFLDLGFYLGFTGVITFPARKTNPQPTIDLLEVVKKCPIERMLVETDSPYLAPQAYRGKRCEPWMVEEVVKKIAELKNMGIGEVMEKVEENTRKLFQLI